MTELQRITEELENVMKEDSDDMSVRDVLLSYCEHILDDLYNLELHHFPSINETEEYDNIQYYVKMIQRDLEEKKDLEGIA